MIAAEEWTDLKVVDVPIIQRLTFNVLLVIMKCEFGFKCDWSVPSQAADGSISVHKSIRVVVVRRIRLT